MRLSLGKLSVFLFFILMGCVGLHTSHEDGEFEAIEFQRGGGWINLCRMTISSAGQTEIRVMGAGGTVINRYTSRLSNERIRTLGMKLADADFFALSEYYEPEHFLYDQNQHNITVIQHGLKKRVRIYDYQRIHNLPPGLKDLIEELEDIFESILTTGM